jgi:zinc/manganese transport system permease protein
MRAALGLGVMLGILFSLMGVFVVTRGMAFFSDFVAHAAILGGALAMLAGIDPGLFLIPFSLIMALLAAEVWNRMPLSRDTVLGVFYGGAVSIGVILVAAFGLGQQRLVQMLFGDILLISSSDLWLAGALLAAFLVFLQRNLRVLVKATFIPEISGAEGINVKAYDYVFIALIAVTIALSIKLIGVILANAMVVIPAASAKGLSRNFRQFIIISPIIGVSSFVTGTVVSYYLNLPSGPSVIATSFVVFILTLAVRRR